ncbi:MAG: O-antigen ligase family protein [bacterium]|nr:O-antigen ligase family protein [bacterium]
MKRLFSLTSKILIYAYYVLVVVTPVLVVPYTSELFEFNKMFIVYGLTIVVLTTWLLKGILSGKLQMARSFLDIPIALFILVQVISYFVSIDKHVSIWGYYSRQHGGILSTISFILLYYGFICNITKETLAKVLKLAIFSGALVAAYGILQHFGIDKHLWVQDVARRVFSSFGQPNWLAAYMNIMLFLCLGMGLNYYKQKEPQNKLNHVIFIYILPAIFLLTILYTKSRSGLLGFIAADAIFWLLIFKQQRIKKIIIIFHIALLLLSFITGLYDTPLHRFTLPGIVTKYRSSQIDETIIDRGPGTVLSLGGTESSQIRKYVWQGALNAANANPFFGTGVETFAWAFYKYRPVEHNLTSEWDFLYNKAHNEYLNFLTTTGYIGLGTYLLLISTFIFYTLRLILKSSSHFTQRSLLAGLLASWISILVTNFFGFSVVVISIFFWLIPASFLVLIGSHSRYVKHIPRMSIWFKRVLIIFILLLGGLLLTLLARFWYADILYSEGQDLVSSGYSLEGRRKLAKALSLRPDEPRYWSELAYAEGLLSQSAYQREESSRAAQLKAEAISFQVVARSISPNNLNLVKDSVRLLYLLSETDPKLLSLAISEIKEAQLLSPNDPKLLYNLALLYSGDDEQSDLVIPTLKESIELKSNYRDARILLGLFYLQADQSKLAKLQFEYVINNINSNDQEAADYLKQLEE